MSIDLCTPAGCCRAGLFKAGQGLRRLPQGGDETLFCPRYPPCLPTSRLLDEKSVDESRDDLTLSAIELEL